MYELTIQIDGKDVPVNDAGFASHVTDSGTEYRLTAAETLDAAYRTLNQACPRKEDIPAGVRYEVHTGNGDVVGKTSDAFYEWIVSEKDMLAYLDENDLKGLKAFNKRGAKYNSLRRVNGNYFNALQFAAFTGSTKMVRFLVDNGAIVDKSFPETNGETALFFAVRGKNAEIAQILYRHMADPRIRNNEGVSVIDLVVNSGDYLLKQIFLRYIPEAKTARPPEKEAETGGTPPDKAALEAFSDAPECRIVEADTLDLAYAALKKSCPRKEDIPAGVRYEVHTGGGDVVGKTSDAFYEWIVSEKDMLAYLDENDLKGLKAFNKRGAKYNSLRRVNGNYFNALQFAAFTGNTKMVRFLVDNGAIVDKSFPETNGETALFFAVRGKNAEIAQILYRHMADPEIRNNEGTSVIDLVKSSGDYIMKKIFVRYIPDTESVLPASGEPRSADPAQETQETADPGEAVSEEPAEALDDSAGLDDDELSELQFLKRYESEFRDCVEHKYEYYELAWTDIYEKKLTRPNWIMFLFPIPWLFYRKFYGLGFSVFFAFLLSGILTAFIPLFSLLSIGTLLLRIFLALEMNKMYFRRLRKLITTGKELYPEGTKLQYFLFKHAGTSIGAVIIVLTISLAVSFTLSFISAGLKH